MKRNEQEFIEEITENFSELFVEAFYIRYLREFSKERMMTIINLKFHNKLKKLHLED